VDQALSWIAEVLNEPQKRVRRETPRVDLKGWDSLGQLVLMSALDARFGIRFTQEELESLTSVQGVLDALERNGRLLVK
jgi:acyl carrier protein